MSSAKVANLKRFQDVVIEGDAPAFVEPGKYDLVFAYWETAIMFRNSIKLALWFRIVTQGKYFETMLARWYNVRRIKGQPAKYGNFSLAWGCDFVREYTSLFGRPSRRDRIPMTAFQDVIIRGSVRTVYKNSRQKRFPKDMRYSVIEELIKVKEI